MNDKKSITLVPYNLNWPRAFEIESTLIKEALGNNCLAVHHIGSTAVPGLTAKPIIDIISVVMDPSSAIEKLENIDIYYKGEYNIPFHYGFSKRGEVDINLHMYEPAHPEIELNIVFRNYLRSNPQARDDYAALKKHILSDKSAGEKINSSFSNYTLKKGEFIRHILRQAGFNTLRMVQCNEESERDFVQGFRDAYYFPNDLETGTLHHPDHRYWILYQGADRVGYSHIQLNSKKNVTLRFMGIEAENRNAYLGKRFLALCERWLKNQGYEKIYAHCPLAVVGFFKKQGYTELAFNDLHKFEGILNPITLKKSL